MFDKITQLIPTIQGEGPKVGTPSLLIRFRDCNLNCPFCDTQWSNKHTEAKFSWSDITNYLDKYPNIDNIMITGGEPFIYASEIAELTAEFIKKREKQIKTVEIESNGTLINEVNCAKLFMNVPSGRIKLDINISPKLGPECYRNRTSPADILDTYIKNSNTLNRLSGGKSFNYIYKIVYQEEWKNYILKFLDEIRLPHDRRTPSKRIYIMPISPDYREYDLSTSKGQFEFSNAFRKSCITTAQFCLETGYKFSPREHVWIYLDVKNEQIEVMKNVSRNNNPDNG